jgi:hypothetical protein
MTAVETRHILDPLAAVLPFVGDDLGVYRLDFVLFDWPAGYVAATDQYQLRAIAAHRYDLPAFQIMVADVPALCAELTGRPVVNVDTTATTVTIGALTLPRPAHPFPKYEALIDRVVADGLPVVDIEGNPELDSPRLELYKANVAAPFVALRESGLLKPFIFRDGLNWFFLGPVKNNS